MLMHFSYPHRGLIILHFITCKIMVYKHRVIPLTIRHHLGTEFAHHGLVQEYPLCRTTAPTEHKTHCHHVTQDKLKEEILQNLQIFVCIKGGWWEKEQLEKVSSLVLHLIWFHLTCSTWRFLHLIWTILWTCNKSWNDIDVNS